MPSDGRPTVFLVDDYCDVPGGAEKQMHREAEYLEERGYRPVSVGFKRPSEDREAVTDHVLEESDTRLFRIGEKVTLHPGIYSGLRSLLEAENPDIVHIHKNINYPLSVLLACRGRPVIKTHHDFTNICPSGWAVYQDNHKICSGGPGPKCVHHGCKSATEMLGYHGPRYAMKAPLQKRIIDKHIAPSRRLNSYLDRFGYDTTRIPNPAPKTEVEPSTDPGDPWFLFVGRLTEEKGPAVLLRAVSKLVSEAENSPEAPVARIAGAGPMREELVAMSEQLGISNAVEFLGYVPEDELEELYLESRALVAPSIWMENFPTTVLEALSLGRPVIGSDRGGIPELVGDGQRGAIFDPRNPEELATTMREFLDNPEIVPVKGSAAIEYIESELDEAEISEEVTGLIDDLAQ